MRKENVRGKKTPAIHVWGTVNGAAWWKTAGTARRGARQGAGRGAGWWELRARRQAGAARRRAGERRAGPRGVRGGDDMRSPDRASAIDVVTLGGAIGTHRRPRQARTRTRAARVSECVVGRGGEGLSCRSDAAKRLGDHQHPTQIRSVPCAGAVAKVEPGECHDGLPEDGALQRLHREHDGVLGRRQLRGRRLGLEQVLVPRLAHLLQVPLVGHVHGGGEAERRALPHARVEPLGGALPVQRPARADVHAVTIEHRVLCLLALRRRLPAAPPAIRVREALGAEFVGVAGLPAAVLELPGRARQCLRPPLAPREARHRPVAPPAPAVRRARVARRLLAANVPLQAPVVRQRDHRALPRRRKRRPPRRRGRSGRRARKQRKARSEAHRREQQHRGAAWSERRPWSRSPRCCGDQYVPLPFHPFHRQRRCTAPPHTGTRFRGWK